MSDSNLQEFRRRLIEAEREHQRREAIDRARNGLRMFPWTTLAYLLIIALVFKAFVLVRIGEGAVSGRLAAYSDPGMAEQIGIFLMQPDPVSRKLQSLVGPLVGSNAR
ncbi:MAG: hypothetical protein ACE5DK_11220 [Paracoccaceae bacterium]